MEERKEKTTTLCIQIHKSLELVDMCILMGANKGNAMENKGNMLKGAYVNLCPDPSTDSSTLSTLSSPVSCKGFLVMNDREQFCIATGLMACGRTIRMVKFQQTVPPSVS